jgi:hypothetical protein
MSDNIIYLFGDKDSPSNIGDSIGEAFDSVELIKEKAKAYEKRFNVGISGMLAIILWSAFLYTGYWHLSTIKEMSLKYVSDFSASELGVQEVEDRRWQNYERATALINDTAKTLYAVLTPLAATATGFYFSSKATESTKD